MLFRRIWLYSCTLTVFAAIQTPVSADPIATGPFYLRQDAATADKKEGIALIVTVQKQIDGIVYLCSTLPSSTLGRQRQSAVRDELIANGVPSLSIQVGRRCSSALRHPPVSDAANKDAVVAIIGPNIR